MATNLIDRANVAEVVMVDQEMFYEFKTEVLARLAVFSKEMTRFARILDGNGKEGVPIRLSNLEKNDATHFNQHEALNKQIDRLDGKLDNLEKSIEQIKNKLDVMASKPERSEEHTSE